MLVGGFRKVLLTTTALVPLGVTVVGANPLGPSVVAGSATVHGLGTSNVTVTQSSSSAIINWNTFNIGSGEKTTIVQPSASSVQLDRVTGGLGPSQILGSLSSNGRVFLVNPDGILFGKDAQINVGGLLATTHDISNSDFMAGRYNFTIPGLPDASVVNQGAITAQTGGFAALVAPGVRNTGTISATLGKVGLASANGFSLDLYGDRLITLRVGDQIAAAVKDVSTGKPLSSLVSNEGKITANGGRVELTAAAARTVVDSVINNKGVIEANSIGTRNGMIVLGVATGARKPVGSPTQLVKISGKLSAAGKGKGETGGKIQITGESIQLVNATLDASGRAGGGKVLVGGDTGGGTLSSAAKAIPAAALEATPVPTASQVSVDAASTVNVSAIDSGNGGKAILWSDAATQFGGTILATGGAHFGNGGFVETSSHGNLGFSGSVDVGAPKGLAGTLLLDPKDVTIGTTGAWIVTPSAIQNALASGNVIVSTAASGTDAGDITVAQNVSWSNGNSLTLSAYRNIAVNANITNTGGAAVNLRADNSGTGVGTVAFGPSALISTSGAVSIYYNPSVNPAGSVVNSTSYVNPIESFTKNVPGGAQLTAYMLVNSVYDLQNMQNNLTGDYALGKNIDASATAGWNGGTGFSPIGAYQFGSPSLAFNGVLNGQQYSIDGLTIHSTGGNGPNGVGLFGAVGQSGIVNKVNLTNANISGGRATVGGLAGINLGTISNSNVGGTIAGTFPCVTTGCTPTTLGGLVGSNGGVFGEIGGMIVQSSFSGLVSGDGFDSGGLVGANRGVIVQSFSSGAISGTGSTAYSGGLAGLNTGTIVDSYSRVSITLCCARTFGAGHGGLIGYNGGQVTNSFATGSVVDNSSAPYSDAVGGLVGDNFGTFTNSFASGSVSGTANISSQGIVGIQFGTLVNSYVLTDAQLRSALPSGFATGVWALNANIGAGYPYLKWQTASSSSAATLTGPQTIVVAADPETKIYGSNDPLLAWHIVSGFLAPGDSFSGSLSRVAGENVSFYAIGQGTLSLPSIYSLTFQTALLTISPATLTITANDAPRAVGQANPAFTARYSGFVLGQNESVISGLTFSTPANLSSSVGSYPIIPSGASAPNYVITYVNGSLSVAPVSAPAPTPFPPDLSKDPYGLEQALQLGDKTALAEKIRRMNEDDEARRLQNLDDEARYKANTILLTEAEISVSALGLQTAIYGVFAEAVASGVVSFTGNGLTLTKVLSKAVATELLRHGLDKILVAKDYIPDDKNMNLTVRVPLSVGTDLLSLTGVGGLTSYMLELVIKREYLLANGPAAQLPLH